MADTVRHSIIDNLLARFQAVSIANGYTTDFVTVSDYRLYPFDDAELPAIVIMDGDAVVKRTDDVITDYEMEFTVNLFVSGSTAAGNLRNMAQDVYACIKADRTCGGYAEDVIPDSETMSMQMKDNIFGDMEIKFKISYTTGAYDPTKNYN